MKKPIPFIFLLCFILLLIPYKVNAHAYLDHSMPTQEAELEESPNEIRLKFTEPIDTNVSTVTIKTEHGELIEAKQQGEDNIWLVLDVSPLQDGIYYVDWQVLSLDTHVTDGSYRFSVGVELPPNRPAETIALEEYTEERQVNENHTFNWNMVLRTIDVIVITSIAGLFFFTYWIIDENSLKTVKMNRITITICIIGLALFLLTGFGHLYIRAQPFTQGTWTNLDFWRTMGVLATSTVIGVVSCIRPILLGASLIFFIKSHSKWVTSFFVLLLILTFPLTGHALQFNMVISHFLHLLASAIWFGGLLGLIFYSFRLGRTYKELLLFHKMLKRFSVIAFIMILMVSMTGFLLSLSYVPSLESLRSHDYGGVLLWKLIFFILALIIAGVHRFILLPKLLNTGEEHEKNMPKFLWAIRCELLAALTVVILAGVLSTSSPPVNSHEHQVPTKQEHHNH